MFLKISQYLQENACVGASFLVGGLQACNFIKIRVQHKCFPVKTAKILKRPFLTEHLWLLLLTNVTKNTCDGIPFFNKNVG